MNNKLFRILWIFDSVVSVTVVFFFLVGIMDGSVSSFNMEIWLILLLILGIIMSGSIFLKKHGHLLAAFILLWVLAIPGLIYVLFFLVIILTNPSWN